MTTLSAIDTVEARKDARNGRLFAGLSDAASEELLDRATMRHAQAGEILLRQGDAPERLLLVARGLARMTRAGSGGAQATLRLMGAGELIGCVAVIRGVPYPATATALKDSVLLAWAAPDLLALMSAHPALMQNLLAIIGDRTIGMVEHIGDLSAKTLEQRLAAALLRLARQAGSTVDGRTQIKMSNARDDLAALAGAGYFTISRVLGEWRRQGAIESGRQRIVIVDEARLKMIAAGEAGCGARTPLASGPRPQDLRPEAVC